MRHHVNRTANPGRPAVQNMGVDHGRLHVVMAQEFLDSADVVAAFEEMSGGRCGKWHVSSVGLLGPPAVVAGAPGLAKLVEQLRLGRAAGHTARRRCPPKYVPFLKPR